MSDQPAPPPPPSPSPPSPPGGGDVFDRIRATGLVRPDDQRWLAGVCAAAADRAGVDPMLVRGILVALGVVSGGLALVVYGLAWALLPQQDGTIHTQRAVNGEIRAGLVGAVALFLIGLTNPAPWWVLGWSPWGWWPRYSGPGPGGLIFLGLLIGALWWFLSRRARRAGQAWADDPNGPADPGQAPAPGAPAPQWTPPQPRSRPPDPAAPSHRLTRITLGCALLAAGVVGLWDRLSDDWPDPTALVAMCVALAVIATGIVAAGVLGRRPGGLAPIGVILALGLVIAASLPSGGRFDGAGDRFWQPGSQDQAERGLSIGAGDLEIDLTDADLLAGVGSDDPVRMTTSVGVGELVIVVPENTAVEVEASAGVGTVRADVSDAEQLQADGGQRSGAGTHRTFRLGQGDPVLVIDAQVGLGEVNVRTAEVTP